MKTHRTRRIFSTEILPNPKPTQDIYKLAERLDVLRLLFATEHLGDLVSQSVKHDWNATQFLDELLRLEIERQEERRIAQSMRITHFPSGLTLSNFDFTYQSSVSRSQPTCPSG